jgi:hypothetical protein
LAYRVTGGRTHSRADGDPALLRQSALRYFREFDIGGADIFSVLQLAQFFSGLDSEWRGADVAGIIAGAFADDRDTGCAVFKTTIFVSVSGFIAAVEVNVRVRDSSNSSRFKVRTLA